MYTTQATLRAGLEGASMYTTQATLRAVGPRGGGRQYCGGPAGMFTAGTLRPVAVPAVAVPAVGPGYHRLGTACALGASAHARALVE